MAPVWDPDTMEMPDDREWFDLVARLIEVEQDRYVRLPCWSRRRNVVQRRIAVLRGWVYGGP